MQRNYTPEDVKTYRDKNSCSVFEAKAYFEREHLLTCLVYARVDQDFDLLCDIVEELIKRNRFDNDT